MLDLVYLSITPFYVFLALWKTIALATGCGVLGLIILILISWCLYKKFKKAEPEIVFKKDEKRKKKGTWFKNNIRSANLLKLNIRSANLRKLKKEVGVFLQNVCCHIVCYDSIMCDA